MTRRSRIVVLLALLAATPLVARQQPAAPAPPASGTTKTPPAQQPRPADPPTPDQTAAEEQLPRFRGGANLVRVDTYVSVDGTPLTDLTAQDFEVLEDNIHQRIESFEFIRPRPAGPQSERREPNTVAESRQMAASPDSRLFVLFMDVWHVQIEGSYRAQQPIVNVLNRVIGQDDMVGVMTPEMSARNMALARRTATIEGMLKDSWNWGQRNQLTSPDPRDEEIKACYPDSTAPGIAAAMISRRHEGKTLDALEDLVVYLEALRDERKFVMLLSEGWKLEGVDQNLARPLKDAVGNRMPPPQPAPIGVDPRGKLSTESEQQRGGSFDSCERERSMLAYADHATQFQNLLQRANRANVSFYPMDMRGLVVFDEPIGPNKPPPPSVDAAILRNRHEALRALATDTDGYAVLDTNAIDKAVERVLSDTGSYYLLGYYSSNTKLDGKFRRITVRVKRPNANVRARPGYLAPTEAELASNRVDGLMKGRKPGYSTAPPEFTRALERLTPARGVLPVRVQAAAGADQIWVVTELDQTTFKSPEWAKGGQARLLFAHDRGAAAPTEADVTIAPGQRAFTVTPPEGTTLAPGRYVVRLSLTPTGSSVPINTTVDVTVPESAALISQTGIASRRGPSTGLQYVPTADPRFTRTERLRLEIPRPSAVGTVTARLLGRDGAPLPLAVPITEKSEPNQPRMVMVDLTLAPLAQGEYVIEVTAEQDGKKETANYGFRLVP